MDWKAWGVVSIFLIAVVSGCVQPGGGTGPNAGRVVFSATDAAAGMGTISHVWVTIDEMSIQSPTKGWITLSSQPKTIDLLELKADGRQVVLADVPVEAGTYNQLRLHISKVSVTDENGSSEARLPSGELKIVGGFTVDANQTSVALFDFIADESLHVTGNGKYVMAPVVIVSTTENAEVRTENNEIVEIRKGTPTINIKVGMRENGEVGEGLGIPLDAEVEVDSGGIKVKVGGTGGVDVDININNGLRVRVGS